MKTGYRRKKGNTVVEEIDSHHLFDGEQRVLLVDDVLKAEDQPGPGGISLVKRTCWRYQYGNHLGSVGVELDEQARVISYEEFHPYGTSAYRVMNAAIEAPAKRYRYTGMERDEESALNYHNTRYYSLLLCFWISPDTAGIRGGLNLYRFVGGSPLLTTDKTGLAEDPPTHEGVRLANNSPKVNLLSDDDWKLWNVGSHKVIGPGKNGIEISVQPSRGPNLISEHTIPGKSVYWTLVSYFGEFIADSLYDRLYDRMATIIVPKILAEAKTPVDNDFTSVLRLGYPKDLPLPNVDVLIEFGFDNFKAAAAKSGVELNEFALRQLEKQMELQGRQIFGALLQGDALKKTYYHLELLGFREQLQNWANPFEQAVNKFKTFGFTVVEKVPKIVAAVGQVIGLTMSLFGAHRAANEFQDRQPGSRSGFWRQVGLDVATVGFFFLETAVGLVDDLAAGAKALEFGDWEYGEYMMRTYMQEGMSPAQRDLLNFLVPVR